MNIFDAHFHIIDPRFPLVENRGYLPDPFRYSDYKAMAEKLGIEGGAVVSGSFQGFDQEYLTAALEELGTGFVGVTQLPPETRDEEIRRLHEAGVRAVRFNLRRGGSAGVEDLEEMAHRVYELAGWHIELYVNSNELDKLFDILIHLPMVVIDHLGLTREGFPALLRLVEEGAKVKATGFGRLDFDPSDAICRLTEANPEAVMFGTDLPSTRAPRPFKKEDVELIKTTLSPDLAEKVLYKNAVSLYKPKTLLP